MNPDRRKCLFPKDAKVPSMDIELIAFAEYSKVFYILKSTTLK